MLVPFDRAAKAERPWDGARPSVHDWLRDAFDPETGRIPLGAMTLPDAPPREPGQVLGFAPGAEAWITRNHVLTDEAPVDFFMRLVRSTVGDDDPEAFAELYEAVANSDAIIDLLRDDYEGWETHGVRPPVFLQRLTASDLDPAKMAAFATMLAVEAPDSSVAGFALGLMRAFPGEGAAQIAHRFGRHDAFTVEAIEVLKVTVGEGGDYEEAVFALAREVHGWGRVHCVGELFRTDREDIREWLVLEGHRTEALPSEITGICAEGGRLADRLDAPGIEPRLLEATGRLVAESFDDGQFYDLDAWDDGLDIAQRYIRHASAMSLTVPMLNDLVHFMMVLTEGPGWRTIHVGRDEEVVRRMKLEKRPWNETIRAPMLAAIRDVLARPDWPEKMLAALSVQTPYPDRLYETVETARMLGVDGFSILAERVERGEDLWAFLFLAEKGTGTDGIDHILDMADRLLPLEDLAALPRDAEMTGALWQKFTGLRDVLVGLGDAPGRGWRFLDLGLSGPNDDCRRRVVHVLDRWSRDHWPPEAEFAVRRAMKIETVPQVEDMMRRLLDGRPLFEPMAPYVPEEE